MANLANAARTATKTKTQTKRRASSSRSNGGSAAKARTKPSSSRARGRTKSRSRAQSTARNNSSGTLVQKAKAPALAAGGMLLGAAGGVAAARRSKQRGRKLPRPKLKSVSLPKSGGSTVAWFGEKAKAVGDAGYRVADMSSQAAKVEKKMRKG